MKIPYTPEELAGKYIVCFPVWNNPKKLECVYQDGGPHDGHPYLYNSVDEAKNDRYFDPYFDKVVPASEYFEMIKQK